MARDYAAIYTSVWADPHWTKLTPELQSLGYRETAVERALIRADRYDLWATIRPGDVGGTGRNQHTKAA